MQEKDLGWLIVMFAVTGIVERMMNEVCKRNVSWWINTPVSVNLFGVNKTYRGFVNHTLCNTVVFWCFSKFFPEMLDMADVLWIGMGGGFVWCLGELPNSYVKRHCFCIPPGSVVSWWQYLLDHSDSALSLIFYLACIEPNFHCFTLLKLYLPAMFFHVLHRNTMDYCAKLFSNMISDPLQHGHQAQKNHTHTNNHCEQQQ